MNRRSFLGAVSAMFAAVNTPALEKITQKTALLKEGSYSEMEPKGDHKWAARPFVKIKPLSKKQIKKLNRKNSNFFK